MLIQPNIPVPITEIDNDHGVQLCIKREDMIHPQISGNKFWKLYHNLQHYLSDTPSKPLIITFGGAFSNHIAAVAAMGNIYRIPTIGVIRGEEIAMEYYLNPTLNTAKKNGMSFRFVSRDLYVQKSLLTKQLHDEFPNSLIIPEGGTNELAILGIQNMLSAQTKEFDYLCTAVGTGGTVAGLSKYAENHQKVIGFLCVKDPGLEKIVFGFSKIRNFELIDTDEGKYGKISDENVRFINDFYLKYNIPLDPIYTSKMMMKLKKMISDGFFPKGSRILCFHTGGLQGIDGANFFLQSKNRTEIIF